MRLKIARARAGVAALALVAAGAVPTLWATSTAGAADGWTGGPVTIRVELDLPGDGHGPAVQEASDVIPGPQIELTSADLIDNPSDWCGTLQVDIDPTDQTVTVGVGQVPDEDPTAEPVPPLDELSPGMAWDDCDFETATVTITGGGFDSFTLVSDALWSVPGEGDGSMVLQPLTLSPSGDAGVDWESDSDDSVMMEPGGTAVFSYTVATTPTTTTPTTAPATTLAPVTTSAPVPTTPPATAQPAAAVPAQPTFTG